MPAAVKAVESLMGAKARTPEGDRLDVLVTLIEGYERQHFPMDLPDAVEAIKFRMEQQGLTPKDLEPLIGRSNRVYEVLNRRRGLTLAMIQNLHVGLGIPAESLLRQPCWCPQRADAHVLTGVRALSPRYAHGATARGLTLKTLCPE